MRIVPFATAVVAAGFMSACLSVRDRGADGGPARAGSEPSTAAAEALPRAALADTLQAGPPVPPPLAKPLPAAPHDNLWARLRDGFELPESDRPAVRRQREYFAGRQAYMDRVAERARPWLHYIVEAIDARGMPLDLALLPVVESAFRPFAYSHGRAAGLWQFVPATGRHFGLAQNWWYDGRRDVIAATEAALDYLDKLHGLFDGDWLLAVAAYNAGQGTVLRAVRRNERADRPTDFWHLDLPRETEGYVPRLLALRDLVAEPSRYGLSALPPIPNRRQIAIVDVDTQIDLALASDLAGISIEDLYRFNPGYNRWATAPDGPHRVVLPLDRVQRFREGLAATEPQDRIRWQRHRVARGESLIAIADRYHTSVDVIREANELQGNLIRAGDALIVPVASRPRGDYALSASQRLARTQDRERQGHRQRYTVRRGDTFWEIARRFGVGVRELTRWNGMAPGDTLGPGQELVVWTEDGGRQRRPYTVRRGDTLWELSRRFDVGMRELARWNGMAAGDTLRPGQELVVRQDGTRANRARGGPRKGRLQSVRYTVRRGDSLYHIAQRFKVSVSDLRRWNDLARGGYLQPGQELRMEVDVTRQSDG